MRFKEWGKSNISTWLLVIFTAVIATSTIIYTCYARKQWKAMGGQLTAMQGQLEEMRKQTTLIRQQLVGSQAALLQLTGGVGDTGQLSADLQNIGHVTATDIHLRLEVTRETLPTEIRIDAPLVFEQSVPPLQSGKGFSYTWPLPWRPQQLTQQQEWPRNWPGSETFTVRWELRYQNGFGETEREEFCQKWLPNFTIKTKAQSSGGGGMYSCKEIHAIIRSILEQERKAEQEQ